MRRLLGDGLTMHGKIEASDVLVIPPPFGQFSKHSMSPSCSHLVMYVVNDFLYVLFSLHNMIFVCERAGRYIDNFLQFGYGIHLPGVSAMISDFKRGFPYPFERFKDIVQVHNPLMSSREQIGDSARIW